MQTYLIHYNSIYCALMTAIHTLAVEASSQLKSNFSTNIAFVSENYFKIWFAGNICNRYLAKCHPLALLNQKLQN